MYIRFRHNCFKLEPFVYIVGLILMIVYLVLGVSGVVWFVYSQTEQSKIVRQIIDHNDITTRNMKSSLIVMGTVLVISLVGLLTCLLLVMGVKTEQVQLLIPWQVFHVIIIAACFVGGFYQAMHYTVLAEREDTLKACL